MDWLHKKKKRGDIEILQYSPNRKHYQIQSIKLISKNFTEKDNQSILQVSVHPIHQMADTLQSHLHLKKHQFPLTICSSSLITTSQSNPSKATINQKKKKTQDQHISSQPNQEKSNKTK